MKTITSKELRTLTGEIIHVSNFANNQILRTYENGSGFQSYVSLIAVKTGGLTYIGKDYNYSRTTKKYLAEFLKETFKETETKIKEGIYIMIQD